MSDDGDCDSDEEFQDRIYNFLGQSYTHVDHQVAGNADGASNVGIDKAGALASNDVTAQDSDDEEMISWALKESGKSTEPQESTALIPNERQDDPCTVVAQSSPHIDAREAEASGESGHVIMEIAEQMSEDDEIIKWARMEKEKEGTISGIIANPPILLPSPASICISPSERLDVDPDSDIINWAKTAATRAPVILTSRETSDTVLPPCLNEDSTSLLEAAPELPSNTETDSQDAGKKTEAAVNRPLAIYNRLYSLVLEATRDADEERERSAPSTPLQAPSIEDAPHEGEERGREEVGTLVANRVLLSMAQRYNMRCQVALSNLMRIVEDREIENGEMIERVRMCREAELYFVRKAEREMRASCRVPYGGHAVASILQNIPVKVIPTHKRQRRRVSSSTDALSANPDSEEGSAAEWQDEMVTRALQGPRSMAALSFRTLRELNPPEQRHARWTTAEQRRLAMAVQKEVLCRMGLNDQNGAGHALTAQDFETVAPRLNWKRLALNAFHGKKTEQDCMLRWTNHLSPLVNQEPWLPDELSRLKEIAESHGLQDWFAIASELGTARTAFHCLQMYQRNLNPSHLAQTEWTKEEEDALWSEVQKARGNVNWAAIAFNLPGRSSSQCEARYIGVLLPRNENCKVTKWTQELNDRLRLAVIVIGKSQWNKIATYVPGKTSVQCRERWHNILDPDLKFDPFSPEEDALLDRAVEKYGSHSWSKVAKQMAGRTDNQCRRRWESMHLDALLQHHKEILDKRCLSWKPRVDPDSSASLAADVAPAVAVPGLDKWQLPKKFCIRLAVEEKRRRKKAAVREDGVEGRGTDAEREAVQGDAETGAGQREAPGGESAATDAGNRVVCLEEMNGAAAVSADRAVSGIQATGAGEEEGSGPTECEGAEIWAARDAEVRVRGESARSREERAMRRARKTGEVSSRRHGGRAHLEEGTSELGQERTAMTPGLEAQCAGEVQDTVAAEGNVTERGSYGVELGGPLSTVSHAESTMDVERSMELTRLGCKGGNVLESRANVRAMARAAAAARRMHK